MAGAVAGHPGLPEAVLRALTRRHGDRVVAAVAANPDASPELREPPVRKALRAIARHPRATGRALVVRLRDGRARREAAGHPGLAPPSSPGC
ncbi:hypothetical protein [Streptomyces sp. NPDC002530]